MRTSLSEIQEIDRYIQGTMGEAEAVLFQGRLRRNPILRTNVILHGRIMTLIKMYHRKRMKIQLEEVHGRLMRHPLKASWRERVLSLFHNN